MIEKNSKNYKCNKKTLLDKYTVHEIDLFLKKRTILNLLIQFPKSSCVVIKKRKRERERRRENSIIDSS